MIGWFLAIAAAAILAMTHVLTEDRDVSKVYKIN